VISKRLSDREKPRKAKHGRNGLSRQPGGSASSLELLSTYRNRVQELEITLAGLRERVHDLEVALAESKKPRAHFLELFDNTPAAYLLHDDSGYIYELNAAAEMLLGLKLGKGGRPCFVQFVVQGNLVKWLGHMRHCICTGQSAIVELQLRTPERLVKEVQLLTCPGSQSFPHGGEPLSHSYSRYTPAAHR